MKGIICIALVLCIVLSCGCVTMAKEEYRNYKASHTTVPTPAPVAIATPTPEPVRYIESTNYSESFELQMYRNGGRWQGQYYQWHRENVSGSKDMTVNVTVWGHKWLSGYSWWSDSWARYYYETPLPGQKFLFVYVYMEMVGEDQSQDPRMYGMGQDHFYAQYGNQTLGPDTAHQVGIRIKEFEETFTKNDDVRIGDYGYDNIWYKGYSEEKEFWAGWLATDKGYLRMGKSNAWDGYIIYQLPVDSNDDNIVILGRFDGFGNAYWYLKSQPV